MGEEHPLSGKFPMWDRTGMSPPRIPHCHGLPYGAVRKGIEVEQPQPIRDFTEDEKKRVNTEVMADMPYCLHGLPNEPLKVCVNGGRPHTVLITHQHRPNKVAEYMASSGGEDRTGSPSKQPMDLEDDAWGRTSYSRAVIILPFYCPIYNNSCFGWGILRGIGSYHTRVHGTQDDPFVAVKLLARVCVVLNKVVKIYVAHTFRYELRPLHPYDFLEYRACHRLDTEEFNRVKVGGLHNRVYESKELPFSEEAMVSIRSYLESDRLTMVDEMLIAARGNLALGERRAAITMAVTALEAALGDFVTRRLRVTKENESRAKGLKESLGVWRMLNDLFPLLIAENEVQRLGTWEPLDQVIGRLNHVIRSRNELVHQGRTDIREDNAEASVADVSKFIEFLQIYSS